jgi:hypothetical protein
MAAVGAAEIQPQKYTLLLSDASLDRFLHPGQRLGQPCPGAAEVEPYELAIAELGARGEPNPRLFE